eukprot:m.110237 g.110237  ORF g.110237 m.110237 type:complete len:1321 (+) comp15364_c0_seq1:54-4016(+)
MLLTFFFFAVTWHIRSIEAKSLVATNCSQLSGHQATATRLTLQLGDLDCCPLGPSSWPLLTSIYLKCVPSANTFAKVTLSALSDVSVKTNVGVSYDSSVFDHLGRFDLLVLSLTGPDSFSNRAFAPLTSLQSLTIANSIADSSTRYFYPDTFDGLVELETLILSGINIQWLPPGVLAPLIKLETLDLSFNQLSTIPTDILTCTTLHNLVLGSNSITHLPNDLSASLRQLHHLDLDDNHLVGLQRGVFAHFTKLIRLELASNAINQVEATVFSPLTSLQQVDLKVNAVASLSDDAFLTLTNLTRLDISSNQLSTLPRLTTCSRLQHLLLSDNPVKSLAANTFKGLSALKEIRMSNLMVSQLPDNLFESNTAVITLDISNNRLGQLPKGMFSRMVLIETLKLNSCALTTLHARQFTGLTSLDDLQLSSNALSALPSDALNGLGIIALDLSSNDITANRRETLQLTQLKSLYLTSNRLSILSTDLLKPLSALRLLDISNNSIQLLEQGLPRSIRAVYLSENQISTIPTGWFAKSDFLQTLDIGNNRLTQLRADYFGPTLPDCLILDVSMNLLTTIDIGVLSRFPSLASLILSSNELSTLPPNLLVANGALTFIDLSNNQLAALPANWLSHTPYLNYLYLYNNQLTDLQLTTPLPDLKELGVENAMAQSTSITASISLQLFPALQLFSAIGVPFGKSTLDDAMAHATLTMLKFGSSQLCKHSPNELVFGKSNTSALLHIELVDSQCQHLTLTSVPEQVVIRSNPQLLSLSLPDEALVLLNVTSNPKLSVLRHVRVSTLDISFTSLPYSRQYITTTGQFGLYARGMLEPSTYKASLSQIISDCHLKANICDLSKNSFVNNVPQLNQGYAYQVILQSQTRFSPAAFSAQKIVFRSAASLITLGDAPVKCNLVSGTYEPSDVLFYEGQDTLATTTMECGCSPGYTERKDGSCFLHRPSVWELFRKSRAAVAILSLFIIALVAVPVVVLIRRRLARLSHDVELHQHLLADAEEDVVALKKGWEIGGEQIKLLTRVDGDSPGAFGEVWKADWEGLDVCVKVLKQTMSMDESLSDFDAEISFLQRSRSPYLVRFFGAGQLPDSKTPFLVLELMELGSLDSFLQRHTLNEVKWACRVSIAQDIAGGMDYIHNILHKLHRDLKSGNVLCTGSPDAPRVKIGDFGSIKEQLGQERRRRYTLDDPAINPDGATIKMTRGIGTPVYMAIEVIRGDDYDGQAEVWSYGVMLYEIATHRVPDLLTELPAEAVGRSKGPYLGQVLKLLEAGHRLELPEAELREQGAPEWYSQLMARCMLERPEERPGFGEIYHEMDSV